MGRERWRAQPALSSEDGVRHMPRRISAIRAQGKVAFVMLTRDRRAVIDAADVPVVSGHYWRAHKNSNGKLKVCTVIDGQVIYLHRLLCVARYGIDASRNVYHLDGDGLNNRRVNLVVPYLHAHLKEKLAKARKNWKPT